MHLSADEEDDDDASLKFSERKKGKLKAQKRHFNFKMIPVIISSNFGLFFVIIKMTNVLVINSPSFLLLSSFSNRKIYHKLQFFLFRHLC